MPLTTDLSPAEVAAAERLYLTASSTVNSLAAGRVIAKAMREAAKTEPERVALERLREWAPLQRRYDELRARYEHNPYHAAIGEAEIELERVTAALRAAADELMEGED